MPELPEVETIVRRFRPLVEGRCVTGFASRWPRNVSPSVRAVRRALVGRTIVRLRRRAKYIIADLDRPGHLLIHLRMSGRLEWAADHDREPPYVRAVWTLDDGDAFWLVDMRKFGTVAFVEDWRAATAHLGPEPLERTFSVHALERLLRRRSRQLKPLLLDQTAVAGLGNIYADEALFRAGLHPAARSGDLNRRQIAALHKAIKVVLRRAIRYQGTSLDWIYPGGRMQERLEVYGRAGEPCRRCRTPITALRIAQRGTHICPRCQKL